MFVHTFFTINDKLKGTEFFTEKKTLIYLFPCFVDFYPCF